MMLWNKPQPTATQPHEWINTAIGVTGLVISLLTILGSQWGQFLQLKNDNHQIKNDLSEIKSQLYPRKEAELTDRLYSEQFENLKKEVKRIDSK